MSFLLSTLDRTNWRDTIVSTRGNSEGVPYAKETVGDSPGPSGVADLARRRSRCVVFVRQHPADGRTRPATIRDVKPPFTFTITTTTPDGRPQPGVPLRCLHPRSERGRALVDATARTDDSGTARFIVRDANLVMDRYIWFQVVGEDFAGRGPVGISPLDHESTLTFRTLPLQERTLPFVDPQGNGRRRCAGLAPMPARLSRHLGQPLG